jgi:hypothetical protein
MALQVRKPEVEKASRSYAYIEKPGPRRHLTNKQKRDMDSQLALPKGKAIRVIDKKFIEAARRRPRCEWCNKPVAVQASHSVTVGAGGADDPGNLVSLCPACHADHHSRGVPSTAQLQDVARRREREEVGK